MPTMIINAAENANATLSNLAALGTEGQYWIIGDN